MLSGISSRKSIIGVDMNYDDLLWKCQGILEPKDYMRLAGLIVAERELRYTNEQLKEKYDEMKK